MRTHKVIAIDGPAAAGKGTLAKSLARRLGFMYVDTGALYRVVGLAAIRAGYDTTDVPSVCEKLLPTISVSFKYNREGEQRLYLNEEDVTDDIRLPEVSMAASNISAMPAVRQFLLDLQRRAADAYDVVMDGRDVGTVIFPDADLKLFLTASLDARAMRRCAELTAKEKEVSLDGLRQEITIRDHNDSTRATAPLKPADDAVMLDNTDLSIEETVDHAVRAYWEHVLP